MGLQHKFLTQFSNITPYLERNEDIACGGMDVDFGSSTAVGWRHRFLRPSSLPLQPRYLSAFLQVPLQIFFSGRSMLILVGFFQFSCHCNMEKHSQAASEVGFYKWYLICPHWWTTTIFCFNSASNLQDRVRGRWLHWYCDATNSPMGNNSSSEGPLFTFKTASTTWQPKPTLMLAPEGPLKENSDKRCLRLSQCSS